MIRTYESFSELADAMTDGECILHTNNCPGSDGCIDWQRGVQSFAGWLDHIGVKVLIPDDAIDFYRYAFKGKDKK
jgi:hypothetical protein